MTDIDNAIAAINNAQTAVTAAAGQVQSIISVGPIGSPSVSQAQAAQQALTIAGTSLAAALNSANIAGQAAATAAANAAGDRASTAAAPGATPSAIQPASPPPSSVSIGAAVTMVLGAGVAGGIGGWALRAYAKRGTSTAAKPNPLRRRR